MEDAGSNRHRICKRMVKPRRMKMWLYIKLEQATVCLCQLWMDINECVKRPAVSLFFSLVSHAILCTHSSQDLSTT